MKHHLVLFFTRGVSLRTWSTVGMLEREITIYRYLNEHGAKVSFLTYGDASDLSYSDWLGDIQVLCNPNKLPLGIYENLIFSLHGRNLREADVIKTNQTYGAETALWASKLFQTRFVARCGYMWSTNASREFGQGSPQASEARRVEVKVFSEADKIVVTTQAMLDDINERIPSVGRKAVVIPNYVDTDIFRPDSLERDRNTLLFVGRIAHEKNLQSLLEAIAPLRVKLVLIGEGTLRPKLQSQFSALDDRVTWEGNVPNRQLPWYMNRAGIFVLPSLYEGHPKALLEAMACSIPVIGADSPGIREVIRHGDTGYLCGTDPAGIRNAIEELLNQPRLCEDIAQRARKHVLENYSLARIGELELSLLRDLVP